MISRESIFNRSATLSLPVVSFIACVITLLAYGATVERAATWPFSSWIRFALLVELVVGIALAVSDYLFPKKRKILTESVAVLLVVSAGLGWTFAQGLLF